MPPTRKPIVERFWGHVDSSGDGCWPWLLKPDGQGYGQMNVGDRKIVRAHRLSYELNVGPIPADKVVMHSCDNRICVRPDHLKLGSLAENLADCRAKGRWTNAPKPKRERVGRKGPAPLSIEERFWPKVPRGAVDECWPWQGTCDPKGYGMLSMPGRGINGAKVRAHRVAYKLVKGEIPAGLVVMHSCDNPPCCNPAHLIAGTRAENNRDRSAKGRGRENRQRGADNPMARLTAEDVAAIRAAEGTQQAIAARFGISQAQVSKIRRGLSW